MEQKNQVHRTIMGNINIAINASIKRRSFYLLEENAKMESILKCASLLDSAAEDEVDKIKYKDMNVSLFMETMPTVEKQRKESDFLSEMKTCSKIFAILNESIEKDLNLLKSQLAASKTKIKNMGVMSKDELKAIEVKIRTYEQEFKKKQVKYPWLADEQLDFSNICSQMKALTLMREKNNLVVAELNRYRNLSPDIETARHQLNMLKQKLKLNMDY